ncbi:MAG: methyltransferase domain-containing protein [Chitinophagaceae bacterium]
MRTDKIKIIQEYVSCPDCKAPIRFETSHFTCTECQRHFPYSEGILEMLPVKPVHYAFDQRSAYHEKIYNTLFNTKKENANMENSWAPPELVDPKWLRKKLYHVNFIKSLIEKNTIERKTFCDFSGGSGYYTFEFHKMFDWIFHCDLSIESMLYMMKKAEKQNINNMIFIRTDYTQPPFNNSLDLLYCGDSLIYSPYHEGLVLSGMKQSLKEGGYAIFDFHNWWHNPLRRMGLMKNHFGECYSYSKKQTEGFVNHHFRLHSYHKYYQEFANGQRASFIPDFFPHTRHTYIAQKK